LFHVYSPVASAYAGAAAHQVEAGLQAQRDQARAIIAAKRDQAESAGVDARCELVAGDPKRGLGNAAEAAGASLLVVGSRGRTGLERFLIGSAAERAVRSSVIDTLVARSPEGGHYRRILVPVDLFDHSERTLSTAMRLASRAGAVDLLHAIEPVASVGLSQTLGLAMAAVEQETNKRGIIGATDPEELPTLEGMERRFIRRVLNAVGWNKSRAARILGMDRRTLYRKLDRHGIEEPT